MDHLILSSKIVQNNNRRVNYIFDGFTSQIRFAHQDNLQIT